MPKKLFNELDIHKKDMITNVILNEFAVNLYSDASTNSIVKNAGISKGSLFKYFENKEDIYFYILDYVIASLTAHMTAHVSNLPDDLFERTIMYAEVEFEWYIKNPLQYKLFKKVFEHNDSGIYQKTYARYVVTGEDIYYKLFEGVNFSQFTIHKEELLKILRWTLEGFNKEFMEKSKDRIDVNTLKNQYINELNNIINILKNGLK